jgi:hypothetical protein
MIKINPNPDNWAKYLYIASYVGEPSLDDEGNEVRNYDKPVKYLFNYQPLTSYNDIQVFGKDAQIVKKMVIPIEYAGRFKEYDLAYLDGVTPDGEENYGDKANYVLLPPKEGNSVIIIYCQKIRGK